MRKFALLFCTTAVIATTGATALADETTICTAHNQERKIELIANEKGCQVNYTKGDETKTLWSSARSGYCAPHAQEFIEKQKSWGYECNSQTAPAPAQ